MKILFTFIILFISVSCGGTDEPGVRIQTVDSISTSEPDSLKLPIQKLSPADSVNQWLKDSLNAAEQNYWGC